MQINNKEFVRDIIRFLQDEEITVWLFGGWAEEIQGLSLPRMHGDVDLLYTASDFGDLDRFLCRNKDWEEIMLKRFPHKRAAKVDGIMVEFFLVQGHDRDWFTHFFDLLRFDWPEGTFNNRVCLLGLNVNIASKDALEKYRSTHPYVQKAYSDYLQELSNG